MRRAACLRGRCWRGTSWWRAAVGWRRVVAPLAAAVRDRRRRRRGGAAFDAREELSAAARSGRRQGHWKRAKQRLLADVVNLGEVRVKDVMTPRVSLQWLESTGTTQDLLALAKETVGHTRSFRLRGESWTRSTSWALCRRSGRCRCSTSLARWRSCRYCRWLSRCGMCPTGRGWISCWSTSGRRGLTWRCV